MLVQRVQGDVARLKFAESPFVDNVGIAGVVEETKSNKRLHGECCQTSHLIECPNQKGGATAVGEEKKVHTSV